MATPRWRSFHVHLSLATSHSNAMLVCMSVDPPGFAPTCPEYPTLAVPPLPDLLPEVLKTHKCVKREWLHTGRRVSGCESVEWGRKGRSQSSALHTNAARLSPGPPASALSGPSEDVCTTLRAERETMTRKYPRTRSTDSRILPLWNSIARSSATRKRNVASSCPTHGAHLGPKQSPPCSTSKRRWPLRVCPLCSCTHACLFRCDTRGDASRRD